MFYADDVPRMRFADHIVDLLGPLDVTPRRMFGGEGIFQDGLMFALIADDRLYMATVDGAVVCLGSR